MMIGWCGICVYKARKTWVSTLQCLVPPWCLKHTVRLTSQCIPIPFSSTVFKGASMVFSLAPSCFMVPVRQ